MTRRKDPNELTPGEETAVLEYVKNGGDQTKALLIAFTHMRKWKKKTQWSRASTLFAQEKVQERISQVRKAAVDAAVLEEATFLKEVAALASSRISDIFAPNGNVLPVHKWPDRALAAVASIKFRGMREGTGNGVGSGDDLDEDDPQETVVLFTQEVKFWPKNPALDMIFKHLGTYEKDNAQKKDSIADVFANMASEDLELVIEKLREIAARNSGLGLDGQVNAGSSGQVTH